MGDRAVYGFRSGGGVARPTMYLYSHWGGDEQDKTLAEALEAARGRWDDPHYATRIVTSFIIGDSWQRETGYGLSVDDYAEPDYDYINVVDWDNGYVMRLDSESRDLLDSVTLGTFVARHLEG